nr:hypothetical protein [Tanacetum cinerariifolium]
GNVTLESLGSAAINEVPTGISSNSRAMIDLRADEELKDSIVVAMPKLQVGASRQEVSNSNPFDALNLDENDDEMGSNGGNSKSARNRSLNVAHGSYSNTHIIDKIAKLERQMLDGKLIFVDDDGKSLVPTSNVDSESEVEVLFDETANLMASKSFKCGSDKCYGTNSLLEELRETKRDDDYDPYYNDLYESHDMSDHLQAICDDLDIIVHGQKKKWIIFYVCRVNCNLVIVVSSFEDTFMRPENYLHGLDPTL